MSKNYIPKQNLPEKKNVSSKKEWVSQMLISSSVCQVDHYWQYRNLPSKVTMKHIIIYISIYLYIYIYIYIYLSSYSIYMSFLYNITHILQV